MVFMKFDKEDYWMIVKGGPDGGYKEKGRYEFNFDMIHFTPENGEPYTMDYFMPALKNIEFSRGDVSYVFEKTQEIDIDF